MKTYEQMAQSVFAKGKLAIQKREKQKKRTAKMLTAAFCMCFCAGILLWQQTNISDDKLIDDALYPGIKDYYGPDDIQTPSDNITVHSLENDNSENKVRAQYNLAADDFVPLPADDLAAFYDTAVLPDLPNDLSIWTDSTFGYFARNGGTGEVYHSQNVINFKNANGTRSVNIEVAKDVMPPTCYANFESLPADSQINGVKVGIGQSDDSYFFVKFFKGNTGFRIITHGLTQSEVLEMVRSLTK